jgi:putative copper resistance protein D
MLNAMLVSFRFLQFAGALSLLGASLFCIYGLNAVVSPLPAPEGRQWPQRILVASALTAAAGTLFWVMASTALFSGKPTDAIDFRAVWFVFSETRFGRACLWRLGLLLISLAACQYVTRTNNLWRAQVCLGTLILATFAWTGHGAMNSGWPGAIHVIGDVVHLWVAGVWFGALVPLGVLIFGALRTRGSDEALAASYALDRFSTIGSAVVVSLVLSGLINSWFLIGASNWSALFTTAYGVVLMMKLALFTVILGLAAMNRCWFAPRLRQELELDRSTSAPLRALKTSVSIETTLAALLLLAVGVLGTLAPPISE